MTAGKTSARSNLLEWARTLAVTAAIVLVPRTVLCQPFTIPSASMEPTLLVGDYILVNKFAYGWSRHSAPLSPAPTVMASFASGGATTRTATSPVIESPTLSVTVKLKAASPLKPAAGVKRAVWPSASSSMVPLTASLTACTGLAV